LTRGIALTTVYALTCYTVMGEPLNGWNYFRSSAMYGIGQI